MPYLAADPAAEQAAKRAQDLLLRMLSDEQREQMLKHGWFVVRGSSGRRYVIRTDQRASGGNVFEIDRRGRHDPSSFCAYPRNVPHGDAFLAQKLALETDDTQFRRRAARFYTSKPYRHPWGGYPAEGRE